VASVVISPDNVANFPDGGGHFWVYMQYAQGLIRSGCDVYWLERFHRGADPDRDARTLATFFQRMARFGLDGKVVLYSLDDRADSTEASFEYIGMTRSQAEAVLRRADLLLNFHYAIDPRLLACPRRTALVDIDPGLLQLWMSTGQLRVSPHDRYFTTGETVGTAVARFPDCGLDWIRIRPPVCLDLWPYVYDPRCEAFTTVAGWWAGLWIKQIEDGKEVLHENTKRVSFREFVALPRLTRQVLELALYLADGDGADRELFESQGWRVRHSRDVAGTPELYRAYIQASRGEFSCAKPSCMKFQNAWVSDRTLCYLASGKPAVVQHTGPSAYLPNGDGLFRFTTLEEAAAALDDVCSDYERQCRAAREIAAAYFDATQVVAKIMSEALP